MQCHNFVRDRLQAPSTADFPSMLSTATVAYVGDNEYSVSHYVDAQNNYGAMIRQRFTCVLSYNGEGNDGSQSNWTLTDLSLD